MAIKTYEKCTNARLSAHFCASEFACHGQTCHCTEILIDETLVAYLEQIRAHFDAPVYISSGFRCEAHNASVGGASRSYHMRGQAADITVSGISPDEVARYAEQTGILGIGLYDSFVHIDTREKKSFWYSSAQEARDTFGGAEVSKAPILPTLKRGVEGQCVWAVQHLLLGEGYDLGTHGADGIYGSATADAVKRFQADHALTADGIVGNATWTVLLGL